MPTRSLVLTGLVLLIACGPAVGRPTDAAPSDVPQAGAPGWTPRGCAAELSRLGRVQADQPGRRKLNVHVESSVARSEAPLLCEGVVTVAWQEDAPAGLREPMDGEVRELPLRVVLRWRIVAERRAGVVALASKQDEPRPAWLLDGQVEACAVGPLAQLELVDHEDLVRGQHFEANAARRCKVIGPGVSVVPTGEVLPIRQTSDVSAYHDAYRVRVGVEAYWIMPAIHMRGDGMSPVHLYSAVEGAEQLQALPPLCDPSATCWGE